MRRNKILDELNSDYEQLLQHRISIFTTYSEMVENHPYRVLSSYTYDFEEKPLRSDRVADKPPYMDTVSDAESIMEPSSFLLPATLRNISEVPEHDEFVQLVINAKAMASMSNGPEEINWRGYVTHIEPSFRMTRASLRKELLLALQRLTTLSEMERKVSNSSFFFLSLILHYLIAYSIHISIVLLLSLSSFITWSLFFPLERKSLL